MYQGGTWSDVASWVGDTGNEWRLIYSGYPLAKLAHRLTVKSIDYDNRVVVFNEDASFLKVNSRLIPVYINHFDAKSIPSGFFPGIKIEEIISSTELVITDYHGTNHTNISNKNPSSVDFTKFVLDEDISVGIAIPPEYTKNHDIRTIEICCSYAYVDYSPIGVGKEVLKCMGNPLRETFGLIHKVDTLIRRSPTESISEYHAYTMNARSGQTVPGEFMRYAYVHEPNAVLKYFVGNCDKEVYVEIYVKKSNYEEVL